MNKKLFAMMMVPVMVVMGGTLAFSAWSGSANAFFDQSAATVHYTETVQFVHTNAMGTPLSVGNGNGVQIVNSSSGGFQIQSSEGSAGVNANVYANASNLVPGDYAQFTVTVTNKGTATLNTSEIEFASAQGVFYNGQNQQISTPQPINDLQPSITTAYLNSVINDTAGIPNGNGPVFLFNATTSSSSPNMLPPMASIQYTVYAILPTNAPTSYQGFHFALEISIPVSALQ